MSPFIMFKLLIYFLLKILVNCCLKILSIFFCFYCQLLFYTSVFLLDIDHLAVFSF